MDGLGIGRVIIKFVSLEFQVKINESREVNTFVKRGRFVGNVYFKQRFINQHGRFRVARYE